MPKELYPCPRSSTIRQGGDDLNATGWPLLGGHGREITLQGLSRDLSRARVELVNAADVVLEQIQIGSEGRSDELAFDIGGLARILMSSCPEMVDFGLGPQGYFMYLSKE